MELKVKKDNLAVTKGSFTRKEVAALVATGCRHIHSCAPGTVDNLASQTERAANSGTVAYYPWESIESHTVTLGTSQERADILQKIFQDPNASAKRHIKEKIETVFEELTTNALYHSYRSLGKEKYPRRSPVTLGHAEQIQIRYGWNREGFLLEVTDRGGSLKFSHIAEAFHRCYSGDEMNKIEAKESGAGLGFYMVFEVVSHLKVEVRPTEATKISVWISEKRTSENNFSFNFFETNPSTGRQP